jgi:hypothetical protein
MSRTLRLKTHTAASRSCSPLQFLTSYELSAFWVIKRPVPPPSRRWICRPPSMGLEGPSSNQSWLQPKADL